MYLWTCGWLFNFALRNFPCIVHCGIIHAVIIIILLYCSNSLFVTMTLRYCLLIVILHWPPLSIQAIHSLCNLSHSKGVKVYVLKLVKSPILLGQLTSTAFKFFCSSGHGELEEDSDTPILCLTLCPSANRLVYWKLFYFLRTIVDWISLYAWRCGLSSHPPSSPSNTNCPNVHKHPPPPPPTLYSNSLQKDERLATFGTTKRRTEYDDKQLARYRDTELHLPVAFIEFSWYDFSGCDGGGWRPDFLLHPLGSASTRHGYLFFQVYQTLLVMLLYELLYPEECKITGLRETQRNDDHIPTFRLEFE